MFGYGNSRSNTPAQLSTAHTARYTFSNFPSLDFLFSYYLFSLIKKQYPLLFLIKMNKQFNQLVEVEYGCKAAN